MVRRRRLKKLGGDQKQNVVSSELIIGKRNVAPSKLGVDESNN